MSPLKWLKYLVFIENLLGIYRNYSIAKNKSKYFFRFQISVQILLHTTLLIYKLYLLLVTEGNGKFTLMLASISILAYFKCMAYTVTGIYFSRDFISFYKSVSAVSEYFKDDKLECSLRRVICIGITLNIVLLVFVAFRISQIIILHTLSVPILNVVPILVSQVIIRGTILYQHIMLFVVTIIVAHLFKNLSALISAVQERVGRSNNSSDKENDITPEKIRQWVELYRDLQNCCETVTRCFGRQFFFSLVYNVAQLILITYQILYFNITHIPDNTNSVKIIILILAYTSMTMLPLIAGQMAGNQKVKLHRVLVRLYNTMISVSDEAEVKLLKDFIRLIKKNPAEIKLSSKSPVGVYMLPVILSLVVNYVIVMLQFNHVI